MFLFHIGYTIYAYHVFIKTTRDIELIIRYSDLHTFGSHRVFSLRTITCEVKVVQPCVIVYIKHCSFPSLYIGDNHGTVFN